MKNTFKKITALTLSVLTLGAFTSCNKDKPKEKRTVKIAVSYNSPMLQKAAENYNTAHDDSCIELVEYGPSGDENSARNADDLKLEIVAGDIPDIVDVSLISGLGLEKFGMYTDLYPFLDSDEELSREAFFPNVFTSCEKDGKLLSLPVTYKTIFVTAGKTKFFEDFTELTDEYIMELAEKYPDKLLNATHTNSSDLIFDSFDMNRFVDYDSYTCNFNSKEFIDILEFCKKYPAEGEYLFEQDENIRSDKALMSSFAVSPYTNPDFLEKRFGDEEYTVLETDFHYGIRLAITESCPDKNDAWEFIRELYNVNTGDEFPVTKKQFEAKEESFVTSEQYNFAYSVLSEANGYTENLNHDISVIIKEETLECFNDAITSQECAEIIQNRVSTLLSEIS
ncbi:MAG: extracellular solute-binding protein [Ruminococcus sp.]|nr:extracellular solute-binding protein [Ruminococcus sp.]